MARKKEEAREASEEESLDADHTELRVYELGFHIDPELGAEEAKKVYQGIKGAIEGAGTLVAEGEPQKTELAYTVSRMEKAGRRDFTGSYFAWVVYETDGAGHQGVVDAASGENRIFRFIDIRTTKEAAQHATELHERMLAAEAKEDGAEEEGEAVSDTELDEALKEVSV